MKKEREAVGVVEIPAIRGTTTAAVTEIQITTVELVGADREAIAAGGEGATSVDKADVRCAEPQST